MKTAIAVICVLGLGFTYGLAGFFIGVVAWVAVEEAAAAVREDETKWKERWDK